MEETTSPTSSGSASCDVTTHRTSFQHPSAVQPDHDLGLQASAVPTSPEFSPLPPTTIRRGRQVRKPVRFSDYVQCKYVYVCIYCICLSRFCSNDVLKTKKHQKPLKTCSKNIQKTGKSKHADHSFVLSDIFCAYSIFSSLHAPTLPFDRLAHTTNLFEDRRSQHGS
ncbi:unnamed protein product [Dicrocoelium dendriticum]|nr:unnamed protein product [Dicrocoelium dendriticum]